MVAKEWVASLAMHGTIVEVRLPDLSALRQTRTTIRVIEEIKEFTEDGVNVVLRCVDPRYLLVMVLVYVRKSFDVGMFLFARPQHSDGMLQKMFRRSDPNTASRCCLTIKNYHLRACSHG